MQIAGCRSQRAPATPATRDLPPATCTCDLHLRPTTYDLRPATYDPRPTTHDLRPTT